jgi:hypothetical protein
MGEVIWTIPPSQSSSQKESKMKLLLFGLVFPFLLCSCSYLKYASIQAEYSRIQSADPS